MCREVKLKLEQHMGVLNGRHHASKASCVGSQDGTHIDAQHVHRASHAFPGSISTHPHPPGHTLPSLHQLRCLVLQPCNLSSSELHSRRSLCFGHRSPLLLYLSALWESGGVYVCSGRGLACVTVWVEWLWEWGEWESIALCQHIKP